MSISRRGRRLAPLAAQGTVLAVAAFLYFVDLFLPWSQSGFNWAPPLHPGPSPFSQLVPNATFIIGHAESNGWGGAGTVAGVLAGLLFLWEAARVARLDAGVGIGYRSLISSVLCFGVLLFTIIEVAARLTWMHSSTGFLVYGGTFVWIALALAVVIALGGLVHWGLWEANAPAPGHSGGPPTSGEAVTIPPEVPPPAPAGTCPTCGRVNPEDAQFCSACGRSLIEPAPRRRGSPRTPPTS